MTTRKTLKDFLQNVKGIPGDQISFALNNGESELKEGDDLGIDIVTGESLLDLNESAKGYLGDYVNFITSKNNQQIKQGNFQSVSAKRGNHPQSQPDASTDNPHVMQGTHEAAKMNEYSNSGYFGEDLNNIVDKIGIDPSKNKILTEIEGQDLNKSNTVVINPAGEKNAIVQASQNLLVKNNRFSPTAKAKVFKPNSTSTLDFESGINDQGTMQLQNDFGDYDRSKFITNIDKLKDIGKSLLLKAGGWDLSDNIRNSADPNNFELANSFIRKTGISKVKSEAVEARNAYGFPADNEGNSARSGKGELGTEKISEKFGVLNNPEINYYGEGYDVLRKQAAISFIAVKKSLQIVLEKLENFGIKQRNLKGNALLENTIDRTEIKVKGKFRPDIIQSTDFIKKKLFIKTNHSYFDCVDIGIKVIFSSESGSFNSNPSENKILNTSKFLIDEPHYWVTVFMSILKRSNGVMSTVFNAGQKSGLDSGMRFIDAIKNNALLRFMNTLATIGDVHLTSQNSKTSEDKQIRLRDVDSLPSIPATRVMKSRSGKMNKTNLSFSDRNMPAAYLLPLNVVGATMDMNTINKGTNPARGMLGSGLAGKTFTGVGLHGSYNRIPSEVVREIENRLEGEYVPFYITDLRTNEIISFHAFLTNLGDSIQTSYNDATGYGRLDSVKTYSKTTRTVSVSFSIVATNPEDFDEMWYKINKLVTLLYPQYTDGDTITKSNVPFDNPLASSALAAVFKQPFSQVLGATPVVRMRVGDVIKSNYSRFGLSRIFGAGDPGSNLRVVSEGQGGFGKALDLASSLTNLQGIGVNIPGMGRVNTRDIMLNTFANKYGSPISKLAFGAAAAKTANKIFGGNENIINTSADQLTSKLIEDKAEGLVNGFVNPLVINDIVNRMVDPSLTSDESHGHNIGDQVFIRPKQDKPYVDIDGNQFLFNRKVLAIVDSKNIINVENSSKLANSRSIEYVTYTEYEVIVVDPNLGSVSGNKFKITHSDLIADYSDIYEKTYGERVNQANSFGVNKTLSDITADNVKKSQSNNKSLISKLSSEAIDTLANGPEAFMSPFFNPVTRAFETNMGRGLAGTLGGIQFNWVGDYPWETKFNGRAPIGVDISLTLSVIHDLPPGLDHSGYNRAPLYNVGDIMKEVSGDPNGELEEAENTFERQENKIQRRRR